MALHRNSGELPSGAVCITEKDALEYQWKVITNWVPKNEVWIFKYGVSVVGASSVLSSVYINNYYRSKFKLLTYGRMSSFLPTVVLPVLISSVFHSQFVTNDIIIGKTLCPVCVEVRAAAIQGFFSTLYPCIMSPLAAASFATRYYTYNVPSVIHNPKAAFQLWQKFTRPIGSILFGVLVLQGFVGMTVAYYEAKAYHNMQSKLFKLEQEYEMQHGHQELQ